MEGRSIPHEQMNQIFQGHLSRNYANIQKAFQEAGIPESDLQQWIQAGWVKEFLFGEESYYRHFERQIFPK